MSDISRRTLIAGAAVLAAAPAIAAPCKHEFEFCADVCRRCGMTSREIRMRGDDVNFGGGIDRASNLWWRNRDERPESLKVTAAERRAAVAELRRYRL